MKNDAKERPILQELHKQFLLESNWFCADLRKVFIESRRSYYKHLLRLHKYCNMKSYFTSKY